MYGYDPHKLGIDRVLEDQKIRIEEFARESASWRRQDREQRRISSQTPMMEPNRSVSSEPPVANPYPRFTKFVYYLSLTFMMAGLALGYGLSVEFFTGWWQLAGTAAGGLIGFITPALFFLILGYLAYGLLILLLSLLELLWFLIQVVFWLAMAFGVIVAFDHFYG